MSLRTLLITPSVVGYQRLKGQNQPGQKAIQRARTGLVKFVPPGYRIRNSGVTPSLPVIPWISILNPELTTTTQAGLYVVYLYSADMTTLFLSMNQGYTLHENVAKAAGYKGANKELRACATLKEESNDLRAGLKLRGLIPTKSVTSISLGSEVALAKGYEAGHIVGFKYRISNFPDENKLQRDLQKLFTIYDATREINDELRSLGKKPRITVSTSLKKSTPKAAPADAADGFFAPRTPADYVAHYAKRTFEVSPLHEALINEFADFAKAKGWTPKNKKIGKRDLVLISDSGVQILVEAKTVGKSQEDVVRQAIGQLFSYRYVYYAGTPIPLIALFNRPIAELWQNLLSSLGIDVIFGTEEKGWSGTGLRLM